MISVTPRAPKWTPASLPITIVAVLLVLSGCGTKSETQAPPAETATSFEFYVNPQTEQVTLTETTDQAEAQPQATPSDSRILAPNVDIALRNLGFKFESPTKLFVYFQLENITADLDFAQPLFFTLSSESDNLVRAGAPLVTDAQLGSDGVLSPGETTQRFRLEAVFKQDEPFTFLVNANAVVAKGTSPNPTCTNPVTISDANLEDAIRRKLDKGSGDLTCADLESLTTLRANPIIDLEGLQYAVNLTFLNIYASNISDLTPLQNLTKLTQLLLYQNDITDITPLQDLTNLEELNLNVNRISDLSPLQNLTSLKSLSLYQNPISNLAPLRNLTKLTYLRLDDTGVSDISALVNNSGLSTGDRVLLKLNPLSSQALDDVETLRARGVEVESDIQDGCTNPVNIPDENLERVVRNYSGRTVGDLTCTDLRSLTVLPASYNSITNLEGLQYAVNLVTLRLNKNSISDLTPLRTLTKLKLLDLFSNKVSDLTPLKNLTSLTELELSANAINDLNGLQNLTKLYRLSLRMNDISDLAPLENLTNLIALSLSENDINDLNGLQNLTSLYSLGVDENSISDITPLQDLTNLSTLGLGENDISDISALVSGSVLEFGDVVYLYNSPLSPQALDDVETLRDRGVGVFLEF